MNENNVTQKTTKRGFTDPANRVPLIFGVTALAILIAISAGIYMYFKPDTSIKVDTNRLDATNVKVEVDAKTSEAYKDAKRSDNNERYSSAENTTGGVSIPFTFDEEKGDSDSSGDIQNCECTIDDQQLLSAIQRLGLETETKARDHMRVKNSDIYIATDGQLMGGDGEKLSYSGSPIYMDNKGRLHDEKDISVLARNKEALYLGKNGEFIDRQTKNISLLGDLLMNNGVVITGDGLKATRPGNMARAGRSDIYITREGQLVTMDGKPIRHSGAYVYQNEESKIVNRNNMDVAWEDQAVYQNKKGQLVNVSGEKFKQPGILFSYDGILIDNEGMLTKPIVNIEKLGASDLYKTKSGHLVDGYGLPVTHYGEKVRIGLTGRLLTLTGRSILNRSKSDVYINEKGILRVDVGKGAIQAGVIKSSEGISFDKSGQLITRRGRLERRGASDIYLTTDGLLSDKLGKPLHFNSKDTFLDFSAVLNDGSQGLETYDYVKVLDRKGQRVYLNLEGFFIDASGKAIKEVGILTTSDGIMLTSSGKKIIKENSMERIVTKDGVPVTYNGKDVYKDEDGKLYDEDGNPILSSDGRAVYMDENGNLVDEAGRPIKDIDFMAGERSVRNGELTTRKVLTTSSGEKIFHRGKEVFTDATGRLVDANGDVVRTSDGREVFIDADGNLVDKAGNKISENVLQTESGLSIKTGIVAGREQVITKSGKAVKYKGKDVYKDKDGALYDSEGSAILTADGRRIYLDDEGNMVDKNGRKITDDVLTVAGERYVNNGDLATRKMLRGASGAAIKYQGKDVFIGDDGQLVDENGIAIKTKDGRDVFMDDEGNLIDRNGNIIKEKLLEKIDLRTIKPGEIISQRLLSDADGNVVQYDGKDVFVNADGRLVDENGNVVRTKDGRDVFVDSSGNLVDADGNLIKEKLLNTVSKRKLESGEVITQHQLLDSDGSSIKYDGKDVFVQADGRLVDENGELIKTKDGKDVFVDEDGNLVDSDGNKIDEELLTDIKGENVSTGLKRGREKITTNNGESIKYNGKNIFKAKDGSLIDENGTQILTADGKKIFVNDDGDLVDENGNLVDDSRFEVVTRENISSGLKEGREILKTKDGSKVTYDGMSVFKSEDGSLVDVNGNAILTPDGKKIYVTENGDLIDEDGHTVDDPKFKVDSTKMVNSGLAIGLDQITTKEGKAVKYKGKNVFKGKDGLLIDSNGNPITTSDGRKVYMDDDGNLVDRSGNKITEDLLTAESNAVASGDLTSVPVSELKQVGSSDIYLSRDGTLLDKSGKAVTFNGKKVRVGKNGQLFDENGNPILDKNGQALHMNSKGELVNRKGQRVKDANLSNGDGVLLGSNGRKVTEDMTKVGDSDLYRTKDGRLVDQDGRAIKYNGKDVFVDSDGRLKYGNGSPVVDKTGKSVFLDSTGKLVDRNGESIKGNILTNHEKTLIDANGELITSGGKLTKIPGTELYKTADGQVVDSKGRPVKVDGQEAYVNSDGQIVNKNGRAIRFKGQELYFSEEGGLVDRNGQPILDNKNGAIKLSEEGGLVNENGEQVDLRNGGTKKDQGKRAGFKRTVTVDEKPKNDETETDTQRKDESDVPPPPSTLGGKKGRSNQAQNTNINFSEAEIQRLQRRYASIKGSMKNRFKKVVSGVDNVSEIGGGMLVIGGIPESGAPGSDTTIGRDAESDAKENDSSSSKEGGVVYQKAGNMLYAVSLYELNSDYGNDFAVELVGLSHKHPLYKAKAFGTSELKYEQMVLKFNRVCPQTEPCIKMNAIAIDHETSQGALASDIDHHYWYRYGGLFLSSLLEGTSEAMSESGTREESTSSVGARVITSGLEGDKLVLRSLGKVGENFSKALAGNVNRPVTVWVEAGSEMAIMPFDDILGESK